MAEPGSGTTSRGGGGLRVPEREKESNRAAWLSGMSMKMPMATTLPAASGPATPRAPKKGTLAPVAVPLKGMGIHCEASRSKVVAVQVLPTTDMLAVTDRRLADALRRLREHAPQTCRVGEIARQVGVSRRWLLREFHSHFGCTPHAFLDRLRVAEARRLLQDTRLTLADIAERCGFRYESNLRRAFLRVEGISPGRWRTRQGTIVGTG